MFKVKCTLFEWVKDEDKHPCHFNYKIGDTIIYDGERFEGRVCHSLLPAMMPVVHAIFLAGHKFPENIMMRYRGMDIRDTSLTKYDGMGFRPHSNPDGTPVKRVGTLAKPSPNGRSRGHHFMCGDQRTLAHFNCDPIDLADSGYAQPFYRRAISVLEKIEKQPGVKVDTLFDSYTDFQKNVVSPRLTPVFMGILLDALLDQEYITIVDGKATATGREPPSRPVFPPDNS